MTTAADNQRTSSETAPAKRPTGRPTPFRLVALNSFEKSFELSLKSPLQIKSIALTLADDHGNVLVERVRTVPEHDATGVATGETPAAEIQPKEIPVCIDGQPVLDVSHLQRRQILKIETAAYVVLGPHELYLRSDAVAMDLNERAGRLASFSAVLEAAKNAARPDQDNAVIPLNREAGRPLPRKSQGESAGTRGTIIFRMTTLALLSLLIVLVYSALTPASRNPVAEPERPKASPVQALEPAQAPAPPASPISTAPRLENAAGALGKQSATTPEISDKQTLANGSIESGQRLATVVAKPKTTKKNSFTVHAASRRAERQQATSKLSSEELLKLRQLVESFQLEAGYDPEAARQKLKDLRGKAPGDSKLNALIDDALAAIKD